MSSFLLMMKSYLGGPKFPQGARPPGPPLAPALNLTLRVVYCRNLLPLLAQHWYDISIRISV